MNHWSDKLLVIILALMLGIAPLKSVIAASFDQVDSGHHMVDMQQSDSVADSTEMDKECDRCSYDGCCDGSACNSSHCSSCVSGITADFLRFIDFPQSSEASPSVRNTFVSNAVASLYRPPKV